MEGDDREYIVLDSCDPEGMAIMIDSLTQKLQLLRADERVLVKLSGLTEEIEKSKAVLAGLFAKIDMEKEKHRVLLAEKNEALKDTISAFSCGISRVLPHGECVVAIDDSNNLSISYRKPNGDMVSYAALSGGERVMFDTGLASVLGAELLIVEAAELDEKNFSEYLEKIEGLEGFQVFVNTCHPVSRVSDKWNVINL